jgi:hypothetical protein
MTGQTFKEPNPEVQRIAKRYAVRDCRVKVFRQPTNIGAVDNHQFVKDQARGKYFMWAHDDDEFPTNYVEICLAHFKDAPDVVLVGPSSDRYLDGKYFITYENYSSIGLGTYERLRNLMPDGFRCHSRFEQYFSGLCLLGHHIERALIAMVRNATRLSLTLEHWKPLRRQLKRQARRRALRYRKYLVLPLRAAIRYPSISKGRRGAIVT